MSNLRITNCAKVTAGPGVGYPLPSDYAEQATPQGAREGFCPVIWPSSQQRAVQPFVPHDFRGPALRPGPSLDDRPCDSEEPSCSISSF
jgi:hypothetical protein